MQHNRNRTIVIHPSVIRAAALFASSDDSRPILKCASIQRGKDGSTAELAVTDSYRLAVFTSDFMHTIEDPVTFEIAPIAKVTKASHDYVVLDLDSEIATAVKLPRGVTRHFHDDEAARRMVAECGEASAPMRVRSDSYPSYKQLMRLSRDRERTHHDTSINPDHLADACKAAKALAKGGSLHIEVVGQAQPMEFSAEGAGVSMHGLIMPVRVR